MNVILGLLFWTILGLICWSIFRKKSEGLKVYVVGTKIEAVDYGPFKDYVKVLAFNPEDAVKRYVNLNIEVSLVFTLKDARYVVLDEKGTFIAYYA